MTARTHRTVGEVHAHLDADDSRLIERLRAGYAPPELTTSRRVALNDELWDRIECKRGRRSPWVPLVAGAVLGTFLLWVTLPWIPDGGPTTTDTVPVVAHHEDYDAWEYGLLYPTELTVDAQSIADDEGLPADYRGIAAVFLDG